MPHRDPQERRDYMREYQRRHPRDRVDIVRHLTKDDRRLIADLLHEIFPEGLTDDCPARSANR